MTVHRCIVCGAEYTTPTPAQANAMTRDRATGAPIPVRLSGYVSTDDGHSYEGPSDGTYVYVDGAHAMACTTHTPKQVRSAFVLNRVELRKVRA